MPWTVNVHPDTHGVDLAAAVEAAAADVTDAPDTLADLAGALVSADDWAGRVYLLSFSGGADEETDTRSLIAHAYPRKDLDRRGNPPAAKTEK